MNRLGVAVLVAILGGGVLLAQDGIAAFDRAWQQLQASADSDEQARLAARCSDLFLQLDEDSGPRQARLARGVEATVRAGRNQLAIELAATANAAAAADPLLRWQLHALARAGRLAEFAALADARRGDHGAVVDAVLAAEEQRLLEGAAKALRTGQTALGRGVFEALAAVRPPRAWRYANLGLCLRNLGATEAAELAYAKARQLAPEDPQIENDYGLFLRGTARIEDAVKAFRHSHALDGARNGGRPGRGPAITNLMHLQAVGIGHHSPDPLPEGRAALALRPRAAMLRRLVLDVSLDRLAGSPAASLRR